MRYLIQCQNCSHGGTACDELRDDQRCPHCQSAPSTYTENGEGFCWLHRERMTGEYQFLLSFFTEYAWRGSESQFPNAKLFEAQAGERTDLVNRYCCKCQEIFVQWLAQWKSEIQALEQVEESD
jgi:hypothetical protein